MPWLWLNLLTGCTCTEIGCADAIHLVAEHDGLTANIETATVTVGDQVFTVDCSVDTMLGFDEVVCDEGQVSIVSFSVERVETIHVHLTTDLGTVDTEVDLDWDPVRLNGRHCPVTCRSASETVEAG